MTIGELENLIQAYGKDIYSFCLHLTENRQEAEDLYQDTFLTAVERIHRMDASHNPKSYLLSIAIRLWKNQKRKAARRQRIAPIASNPAANDPAAFPEAASPDASPEEQSITREEREAVLRAVRKLPDKYRIPVILFYGQQLSLQEIAALLSLPASTVKSRLHQARQLLRRELEVFFDET